MPVEIEHLRRHVSHLALTPRPTGSLRLAALREDVAALLRESGWIVEFVPFSDRHPARMPLEGVNLLAQHATHRWSGGPRFCVGAHLDSREETPGADDNASAVAALLEIARLLPEVWPARPALEIELAVFDLEESGMLGGADRARACHEGQIDLRGMVSLEMLGYAVDAPGSQSLPIPLRGIYPDVGNFIAAVGNQNSGELLATFRRGLTSVPGLPVETLTVPDDGLALQASRLSDHSPFWDAGFPALMITDTAFLRNPHYHQPTDTIETLNFEFLRKVTEGCLAAVVGMLENGLPG